jgi:hypothetical protein
MGRDLSRRSTPPGADTVAATPLAAGAEQWRVLRALRAAVAKRERCAARVPDRSLELLEENPLDPDPAMAARFASPARAERGVRAARSRW